MIEFEKIEQHMHSRRERLLKDAETRRMALQTLAHGIRPLHRLAYLMGDLLIRIGTRLKASYQPVNFPISTSERGET